MALGLLLLTAAALKFHALWTDPNPPLSFFVSPRWQIAVVEAEGLLGLWLLTGLYPRAVWLAAVAAFAALGGASLYLATIGQPSCDCFGKLPVNPWYTFGLDGAAVVALCYWRLRPNPAGDPSLPTRASSLRPALYAVGGVVVVVALGYAVLSATGSSASAALARLRGESLTVEPEVTDIGTAPLGEERTFRITVRNQADRPIRITGGTVDCSCVTTDDLPVTVPARETRALRVHAELRGRPGMFQRPFYLYTDDPAQPRVVARVAGRVAESPPR